MCIQADKRMDRMETRVTHLETNNKQIVKEELVNSKDEIIVLMIQDIVSIVDERNKGLEERRNKQSSIILFNVPELDGGAANGVTGDIAALKCISNILISENLKIVVHYRPLSLPRTVP